MVNILTVLRNDTFDVKPGSSVAKQQTDQAYPTLYYLVNKTSAMSILVQAMMHACMVVAGKPKARDGR